MQFSRDNNKNESIPQEKANLAATTKRFNSFNSTKGQFGRGNNETIQLMKSTKGQFGRDNKETIQLRKKAKAATT